MKSSAATASPLSNMACDSAWTPFAFCGRKAWLRSDMRVRAQLAILRVRPSPIGQEPPVVVAEMRGMFSQSATRAASWSAIPEKANRPKAPSGSEKITTSSGHVSTCASARSSASAEWPSNLLREPRCGFARARSPVGRPFARWRACRAPRAFAANGVQARPRRMREGESGPPQSPPRSSQPRRAMRTA